MKHISEVLKIVWRKLRSAAAPPLASAPYPMPGQATFLLQSDGLVQPHSVGIVKWAPPWDLVPLDFVVDPGIAEHFLIQDVQIDGRGQFIASSAVPAVMFSGPNGVKTRFDPVPHRGDEPTVKIVVFNMCDEPQRFDAALLVQQIDRAES